ncbi:hypothetical protein KAFR_0G02980 [Kazachstania africana CBS 2517]|uniref:Protein FAF1 n=1 Tax=Kazachstania africana (strain ATCC 22294 / BCRC 22015 / CBS 2517 / CECT 1963 / NBRC 1671 / NRRL Y-8276) TaxID=1071382 RepID=H2AY80_KAZAF|nr:hypothetical protein KAFR_0G02980 [Kazachstania africana CBS 2517]CCF59330.1 hypothetical protein KAFR_0G02980 [Kazachstania africana CBS 2517]
MSTDEGYLNALELQRKAFESQFGSLESMGFEDKTKNVQNTSEQESHDASEGRDSSAADSNENDINSDAGDEHTGMSSAEEEEEEEEVKDKVKAHQPKVIKFSGPGDTYIEPSKKEQKMIRCGQTLGKIARRIARNEAKNKKNEKEDENEEAENLKNDVELQQFLKESHLLSAFSNGSRDDNASDAGISLDSIKDGADDSIVYQDDQIMGKARLRTLEMRLKNLSKANGHEKKINKLEKVPMNVRKGMVDKHVQRIKNFEQDAKDGGIILSKVKKGQFRKIESTYKKDIERRIGESVKSKDKKRNAKRERGLKINTIGRSTRNGLVISKDEIKRTSGSASDNIRKKGGKRRW